MSRSAELWNSVRVDAGTHSLLTDIKKERGIPMAKYIEDAVREKFARDKIKEAVDVSGARKV